MVDRSEASAAMPLPAALQPLVRALDGRPDRAARLVSLAVVMRNQKKRNWARTLIVLALEASQDEPAAQAALRAFWNLPGWYFTHLNDASRLQAYERALRQTVRPGDLVLEIGTGSGILALLAARVGAERVITCEINPFLADCAREIISRNGYEDRITVIDRASQDLRLGVDLPRRAEVLVGDLFTGNLYPGGGLPLYRDAQTRLLTPGARMIPAVAGVRLCLVSAPALARRCRVDCVSGFDFGLFNRFMPPVVAITPETWAQTRPQPLSDPVEAFRMDFSQLAGFNQSRQSLALTATVAGRADGVVWWVWLGLTDTISMDGAPGEPGAEWQRFYHPFAETLAVEAGSVVTVMTEQNLEGCRIWR